MENSGERDFIPVPVCRLVAPSPRYLCLDNLLDEMTRHWRT